MPVNDLEPMSKVLQHDVAEPRFRTVLLTTFASLALLLAAVGIGGVMAYNVSQRTRVRVALGADDRRIVSMVLRQGAKLTAAGIGLGMVGGLLGGRFLSSLLFGVTPHDTSVIGVVAYCWLRSLSCRAIFRPVARRMSSPLSRSAASDAVTRRCGSIPSDRSRPTRPPCRKELEAMAVVLVVPLGPATVGPPSIPCFLTRRILPLARLKFRRGRGAAATRVGCEARERPLL